MSDETMSLPLADNARWRQLADEIEESLSRIDRTLTTAVGAISRVVGNVSTVMTRDVMPKPAVIECHTYAPDFDMFCSHCGGTASTHKDH